MARKPAPTYIFKADDDPEMEGDYVDDNFYVDEMLTLHLETGSSVRQHSAISLSKDDARKLIDALQRTIYALEDQARS